MYVVDAPLIHVHVPSAAKSLRPIQAPMQVAVTAAASESLVMDARSAASA